MTVLAQRDKVRVVAFNKCGHTSIINTFMSLPDGEKYKNSTYPKVLNTTDVTKAVGGHRGDLVTSEGWPKPDVIISFLRNPVHRALSAYQHFFIRNMKFADQKFRVQLEKMGFRPEMSFNEFVDHLLTVDITGDPHLTPQTNDLLAAGGTYSEYLLAPLELIGECWPVMMDNVGLGDKVPCTVLHRNKGDYNPDDYLTPELHGKLRELYSEDFNLWEVVYGETREEISTVSNATH